MENMPYLVVAAGKESEENDCPLVRLSVQVAADWYVGDPRKVDEGHPRCNVVFSHTEQTKA